MDVAFYEVFEEEKKALKRFLPRAIRAQFSDIAAQSEKAPRPPAKLISVRTQSLLPPDWAPHLSGILTRSTGCDHLQDYLRRTGRKIPCGYLPAYCARSVAEHAILTVWALLRCFKKQIRHFDTFNRNDLTGAECLGRRLLVAGVGSIGREIVNLGRGLGMRVQGVDLVRQVPDLDYVTLEQGLPTADILICALPLTPLTRGLLNYENLSGAKKGLIFVNISRGEISPVRDLRRLLEKGILGGIGLDVHEDESALSGYLRASKGVLSESGEETLLLKDKDNVILTPHNAFNTQEALERKARQSAEGVIQFLKTGSFPNAVPPENPS